MDLSIVRVVNILRPVPRFVTRPFAVLVVLGWIVTMGVLLNRSYLQASAALAADLARYGSDAQWQGVYYRGEKIGFTIRQTMPVQNGFELHEDGRLQMSLMGATTSTRVRTTARVDNDFQLQSFEFSLDPGTGPTEIKGTVSGLTMALEISTPAGTRREERSLKAPPVMAVSIGRRLASAGLKPGTVHHWMVFDPATLQNAPFVARVGARGLAHTGFRRRPVPAFEVTMEFAGLKTTSWVTDTGEVIREESPLGLITIRETPEMARAMTVASRGRTDLVDAAAIIPRSRERIGEPRDVQRVRLQLRGADLSGLEIDGLNQRFAGSIVELRDPRQLDATNADGAASGFIQSEPFIESDDPQIIAEAAKAVAGADAPRARAERLVRYVNALLEKKPTVSLPSAREVLRTRVGDCNEHTVLYVAMARAVGIPARISVGLAFSRGAFYYHAWPEVYIDEGPGRGLWLPVDPTFNQFPADTLHLRLARGGLAEQARILPLIGKLEIAVLDLDMTPGTSQVVVGRKEFDSAPLAIPVPPRSTPSCWDWLEPRRR
jgi:hypothetical protein